MQHELHHRPVKGMHDTPLETLESSSVDSFDFGVTKPSRPAAGETAHAGCCLYICPTQRWPSQLMPHADGVAAWNPWWEEEAQQRWSREEPGAAPPVGGRGLARPALVGTPPARLVAHTRCPNTGPTRKRRRTCSSPWRACPAPPSACGCYATYFRMPGGHVNNSISTCTASQEGLESCSSCLVWAGEHDLTVMWEPSAGPHRQHTTR